MNPAASSTTNEQQQGSSPAAHWLPSHVQITIHQARELHLKSKSGHSEVYTCLQVDKERFLTSSIPKQLAPHWNQAFDIPLMSLANTIHITVRQKGRFGDSYLGYIPINPGSFKISPNQITHWYKLGAKPGKSSSKLRGELQVTLQFLSKWSKKGTGVNKGSGSSGMLKRSSSSDLRIQSIRHSDLDEEGVSGMVLGSSGAGGKTGGQQQGQQQLIHKNKREVLASLRRSFRRKTRSPALQNCEDEFASFTSHSASSTPQNIRRRRVDSSSYTVPDNTSNSYSSTGYASNGMSDSDTGNSGSAASHSPPSVRSGKGLQVSDSGDKERLIEQDGSKDTEEDGNVTTKFYNFKSKKRPWSMHTLPTHSTTPTPANTPVAAPSASDKPLDPGHAHHKEDEDEEEEAKSSHEDETEVTTFRYKSRASVLSRSFRSPELTSHHRLTHRSTEGNLSVVPNRHTPEDEGESEFRSNRFRQSSMSEESSTCNSIEGSKTELSTVAGAEAEKREELVKSPPTKSHPYSRRIDISPRTVSPTSGLGQRSRPKILVYGKATDGEGRAAKTGPALLTRRSTLSAVHTGRRLLPAPPMRRGSFKPQPNATATTITTQSKETSLSPLNTSSVPTTTEGSSNSSSSEQVSSFATKLVDSLESMAREKSLQEYGEVDLEMDRGHLAGVRLNTTPSGSTSSIGSSTKEEQLPGSSSSSAAAAAQGKHTVQYKSSAYFSKGFQPATLLPPSLHDYTTRSHTLPVRGKYSKRHSNSTQARYNNNNSPASPDTGGTIGETDNKSPSPTKLSPPNTRYTPQALMDHLSANSLPVQSPPAINTALVSETDGASVTGTETGGVNTPVGLSPTSTSATKQKYAGKTPGEIVTGAMKNRRPVGGLKKVMSMYHDNRRHMTPVVGGAGRRSSEEVRGASVDDRFMRDSDRLHLVEADYSEQTSYSARSSPQLKRSARASSISNLFNSLRRTRSHFLTPTSGSSKPRLSSPGESGSEDQPDSASVGGNMAAPLLNMTPQGSKVTSAPGLLMRAMKNNNNVQTEEVRPSDKEGMVTSSEVMVRVRSATVASESADSASLNTLTDATVAESLAMKEQRFSPNPAGAASAASGSHVRHTTCSSVESEGFHSVNSEEMSLEDLIGQDWSQWSKQELVKELVGCKEKLVSTEERLATADEQLKELKSYMDTLLLRIMETNPSILSANP